MRIVLSFVAWGSPFRHGLSTAFLEPAYQVTTACIVVSPLLLISGCWGFQWHKRWARPILFTYAGAWVGGILVRQVIEIISMFSWPSDLSARQKFGVALGDFDIFVYGSVYAVALVLCLTRSGIKDHFPDLRRGFAPVISDTISSREHGTHGPG